MRLICGIIAARDISQSARFALLRFRQSMKIDASVSERQRFPSARRIGGFRITRTAIAAVYIVTQYLNYLPPHTRVFLHVETCAMVTRANYCLESRSSSASKQQVMEQLIGRSIGHSRAISSPFLLQRTSFYGVLCRRM